MSDVLRFRYGRARWRKVVAKGRRRWYMLRGDTRCRCLYGDFVYRDGRRNETGRYTMLECPVHVRPSSSAVAGTEQR